MLLCGELLDPGSVVTEEREKGGHLISSPNPTALTLGK